ncbi:poly-beta-1,6-N-acetyl-D-glucosamine N-deacetylase [Pedobacter glucosidilyticus]|uniref:Polysaccharide deacetylase family protein n=1 Tax=Pedobacter aquae TaxID=2605747 RepID=A0A5C0VFF2_9SPHI|nr:poly-beta-1,6-N-acetyl-D-glucosamine N-deacetylase [Pedobacter glucosidilyticus]QEK51468.1 polysaccharide deacetylase family protein [Pedobacter aquae]
MNIKLSLIGLLTVTLFSNCNSTTSKSLSTDSATTENTTLSSEAADTETVQKERKPADAKTILARKQVPILCYHQIRDWKASDSQSAKDYITPVATFKEHIKMLADSGYTSILPEQLYNYLIYGDALPKKPVMITFDDTDLDQFEVGKKTLDKHGFKGVYFIMTVAIGKRGKVKYMDKAQIKQLADEGNTIGSHTYDHQNVKKYQGEDWVTQIEKPTKTLKEITGKDITYFAYPFGLWNKEAIPELKKRGMKAAFILSTSRDEQDPLYTIRRIIASGFWSAKTLHNSMVNSFSEKRN